jgi:hypothetical protein
MLEIAIYASYGSLFQAGHLENLTRRNHQNGF